MAAAARTHGNRRAVAYALGLALALTMPASVRAQHLPGVDSIARVAIAGSGGAGVSVLVARDSLIMHRGGYGLASVELAVGITPNTRFRLGSITKQFTSMAVLMLVNEGVLALDDRVAEFFPGFPAPGRDATIEHLLTHTSGIHSYTSMPTWPPRWREDMTPDEVIDMFRDEPADFQPGEDWRYSNSGYVLLGAIIEKVSGLSYPVFLDQRIFTPLGMTSTGYDITDEIIRNRAAGYATAPDGTLRNAAYLSMTQPLAAGGLYSSVNDLARWHEALQGKHLISPALYERMYSPVRLNDGSTRPYGFGWGVTEFDGLPSLAHGGGINGFSSFILRIPEERLMVVVLSNLQSFATGALARRITEEALSAAPVAGSPR
ncbi:MAG: serine hydrolase domain-containing protein [Gemmatimonadaceae bacterium]